VWILVALILVLAAVAVAAAAGTRRWRRETERTIARLDRARSRDDAARVRPDLSGLPAPVARYLNAALGDRVVRRARVLHDGTFRTRDAASWRPFHSTETFVSAPPGFIWDARIRMAPAVDVCVRDAYVEGRGSMRASAWGVIPVVDAHDSPELSDAALQRYLAEAAWFPGVLVPGSGLEWTAVDDSAARATLRDGERVVSIDFRFGTDGLIAEVSTPERFREVRGRYVPTPWSGVYRNYAERDGVRIPLEAEVGWDLPEGRFVYWRGRVRAATYQS